MPSIVKVARFGLALAVPLALLGGCGERSGQTSSDSDSVLVLAVVGGQPITEEDLAAEAERLRGAGATIPDPEVLLNALVDRRAAVHRARELGIDRDPNVIRRIENMLIGKLEASELKGERGEPTEEELMAVYQERLPEFTTPAKVRLALLQLRMPKLASAEKGAALRAKMAEAREKALALPDDERFFGALADVYAEDPSLRARQGDARWFDEGVTGYRWPDEVIAAGFALPDNGSISEVIEIPGDGLYLVKRADYRPSGAPPFESVRARLAADWHNQRRAELRQAFLSSNRSAAGAEVFPERLDDLPEGTLGNQHLAAGSSAPDEPPPLPR